MKRKSLILLSVLFLLFLSGCRKAEILQAVKITEAIYENDDGKSLSVVFYKLSDNSLQFVKVDYNNKTYTLPQLVSASGSRYSDEFSFEFWDKGGKAYIRTGFAEDDNREEFSIK